MSAATTSDHAATMAHCWQLAAAWAIAAAAAAGVVKGTRIGPVVVTLSARHGWGIHVGDALALAPLIAAAAFTVLHRRR